MKSQPHLHLDYIDSDALKIVKTLQRQGFVSYLVGGCVRDLLLGLHPKDFDIATDARPSQVKRFIPLAFVIGKRFRLVLVKRGNQQFEVATFRRDPTEDEEAQEGLSGDNLFGSPEEDARRRDFTINSLFFDPVHEELIDYCGGQEDLYEGWIRTIGEADRRLREDSIRSLRALRLSHKLGLSLESTLRTAMKDRSKELATSVLPRRREEILKILRLDDPCLALQEAFDLEILDNVVPGLSPLFKSDEAAEIFHFMMRQFPQDHEVDPELRSTPTFLFGELLYSMISALNISLENSNNMDRLLAMMRLELGMFKQEQTLFFKALEIISLFSRTAGVRKRGIRRQTAIARHEAFPLAFHLARMDQKLCGEDLMFWWNCWVRAQEPIPIRQRGEESVSSIRTNADENAVRNS